MPAYQLTKRSKNISKSDYVYAEKLFVELSMKDRVNYWPPLKFGMINQIRARLNGSDFPSEKWFHKQLVDKRIKGYLRNWAIANRFFADFYFPRANMVVEIDGKEHDRKQDLARDRIFQLYKIQVIRIQHGDQKKFHQTLAMLEKIPQAKFGFSLSRKKVSETDMYEYFPPEIKPVISIPQKKFVPRAILIKKAPSG